MLITFEGLDGSGKSTQARILLERLIEAGKEVEFIREPGGTELGEKIRDMLLDKNHNKMLAETELFLFSASRAQLVRDRIRPAFTAGKVVICDRFYDSSTAYQGWGRGVAVNVVSVINTCASGGLSPDLTFFIDVPLEIIEQRMYETKKDKDRMESSGREFYTRVRRGYLTLASQEKRFRVLDGTKTIDELSNIVWGEVKSLLEEQKG